MKFKIFGKEEEKKEKEIIFKLALGYELFIAKNTSNENDLFLIAVDSSGNVVNHGHILRINAKTGTLYLLNEVSENIGLSLDGSKRIKIENWEA